MNGSPLRASSYNAPTSSTSNSSQPLAATSDSGQRHLTAWELARSTFYPSLANRLYFSHPHAAALQQLQSVPAFQSTHQHQSFLPLSSQHLSARIPPYLDPTSLFTASTLHRFPSYLMPSTTVAITSSQRSTMGPPPNPLIPTTHERSFSVTDGHFVAAFNPTNQHQFIQRKLSVQPLNRSSICASSSKLNYRPSQPYYPSHFMKGTIIQLASGELKRVEELNTEDFIRSASLSDDLKMDSSTVVRLEDKVKDTSVLLCFSVGTHKVQVSVEATVEHPFFVIGQGWSSCNPERTINLYGLPSQKLQVGDICISLTQRHSPHQSQHQLPSASYRIAMRTSGATLTLPTTTSNSVVTLSNHAIYTPSSSNGRRSVPMKSTALSIGCKRRWSFSSYTST